MAKGSNTLTSHHGESMNSRADKMSGIGRDFMRSIYGDSSAKHFKKFYNRKRRNFLKNPFNWDKI